MRILKMMIVWSLVLGLSTGSGVLAGDITGKVMSRKQKYLPHTVVYVDSVAGDFEAPREHVLMDQKGLVFVPHVLPVLAGTTVDFKNSDDVAHNVFTPDKSAEKFNLGTWPTGEIRSYTFEKRCESTCDAVMLCNVHPEMEAFVVIMQNPYFTVVDKEGGFTIEGVPEGEYTLKVWHPKRKAEDVAVVVPGEGSVEAEFTLKKK